MPVNQCTRYTYIYILTVSRQFLIIGIGDAASVSAGRAHTDHSVEGAAGGRQTSLTSGNSLVSMLTSAGPGAKVKVSGKRSKVGRTPVGWS